MSHTLQRSQHPSSFVRALALAAAASLLALSGCGSINIGKLRGVRGVGSGTSSTAKKQDCAACEKMCAVAGDAEKNAQGVSECKADCKSNCSG